MTDPEVQRVHALLRGSTTGDLRFNEHFRPLKYVIDPADGRLVAPVMVAMLQSEETVLFVPEVVEEALELLVTLFEFDEHGPEGAVTDRWRIYHGEPDDVRWAHLDVDAAKHVGFVVDGDALMRPNPLASEETRVCKAMNQQPDLLRSLCLHHAHIEIENPLMVGLDPGGIDVRGRFEVIRVPAARPVDSGDDALALLVEMHAALEGLPHPAEALPERESGPEADG